MKCKFCKEEHIKNNTGCSNSGYSNSGDRNSGYSNSGYSNSGDRNSGYSNSGYSNSGDRNSGYSNSGYRNSGDRNSGDRNSGYSNSGDRNSGDSNSGDRNSGYFNSNSPKVRIFNQETDMTFEDFNEKYRIYIDLPLTRWIEAKNMTEGEKEDVFSWEQMGGYLKTLKFKEAHKIWWEENPERHKDFLELPNFSADIFKEITGIDVEKEPEIINSLKE